MFGVRSHTRGRGEAVQEKEEFLVKKKEGTALLSGQAADFNRKKTRATCGEAKRHPFWKVASEEKEKKKKASQRRRRGPRFPGQVEGKMPGPGTVGDILRWRMERDRQKGRERSILEKGAARSKGRKPILLTEGNQERKKRR